MVTTGQVLATVALAAAAVSVPQVNAHGFIEVPKSEFPKGTSNPSEWIVEFPPPWTGNWKDPKNFATVSKEKGFATLRSYIEDKGTLCGKTNPNASPKPIPSDSVVKFSRAIVHPGPCEIWLDDKRVMQDDDCEATFGSKIPTWKIDFSSCKGKCMLRWFWLGLQDSGKRWQVYKNCVPLTGTGSSSGSTTTTPKPTTKAPAKNTTPKPTTKAPAKNTTPKPTTKAPAKNTTPKPKATTKAPSKSKEVGGDSDKPSTAKNGTMEIDDKCKAKVKRV